MGKFVPRDSHKARSRARVEGILMMKLSSATWQKSSTAALTGTFWNDAEPILRNYVDGDRRFINNEQYELVNGEWQKVKVTLTETEINKKLSALKAWKIWKRCFTPAKRAKSDC